MPNIEQILEIIERLDGAGIVIEDLELVEEELSVMGFTHEHEEDADNE
jgi:hypothetical protein